VRVVRQFWIPSGLIQFNVYIERSMTSLLELEEELRHILSTEFHHGEDARWLVGDHEVKIRSSIDDRHDEYGMGNNCHGCVVQGMQIPDSKIRVFHLLKSGLLWSRESRGTDARSLDTQ
jgi:hypothetical protein